MGFGVADLWGMTVGGFAAAGAAGLFLLVADLAGWAVFVVGAGGAEVLFADETVFAVGILSAFSFSAGAVEAELSFLALGIRTAGGAELFVTDFSAFAIGVVEAFDALIGFLVALGSWWLAVGVFFTAFLAGTVEADGSFFFAL